MKIQAIIRRAGLEEFLEGKDSIVLRRDQYLAIMAGIAATYPFDEAFYLKTYPDVSEAIKAGKAVSGRDHFLNSGFAEGRVGSPKLFNAAVYRRENPDLAAAFSAKDVDGLFQHFAHIGCREGRIAV